jgi:hypothetical protein
MSILAAMISRARLPGALAAALLAWAIRPAPVLAAAPVERGAVVFVGTDDNIHYCPENCEKPLCITCPSSAIEVRRENAGVRLAAFAPASEKPAIADYGWPTFSPDAREIAYSSATEDKNGRAYAVWVYDIAQRSATRIFESRTERVIYIYWLSDGNHLSFLLQEPRGLTLMLAQLAPRAPIRIVTTGMPLFFDWRGGPGMLAVHSTAPTAEGTDQVSLIGLTPTTQKVERVLSTGRAPFQAPCWSPDHKHLAYIANYHAESDLVVADADGRHPHALVSLPVGENSIEWAPDSGHIAYTTTVVPHQLAYNGIKLVDIADGSSRTLTTDTLAAYFIAPDARHIAYIAVPPDKPYYIWKVIDLKSGKIADLGDFIATDEESLAYRFFDQFALSTTIWSPDSKAFVFAGVRMLKAPPQPYGAAPPPSVWVMPIDGSPVRGVSMGTLAFFSPAPRR